MRAALLQLAEAEEKVSILVEAYEDLEKSNQSDIDAAIERERRTIDQLKAEKEHREKDLRAERVRSKQVEDDLAELQREMEDAQEQITMLRRYLGENRVSGSLMVRIWGSLHIAMSNSKSRLHEKDVQILQLLPCNPIPRA